MKKILTLILCLFPNKIAILFLNLLGHKISYKAKIGFSLIYVSKIEMKAHSKIGHFNFVKVEKLFLKEKALIGTLNYIKGFFEVFLDEKSRIRKQNWISSGYFPTTFSLSKLHIGKGTGITSGNHLDLTKSITFGKHCQVAGIGTQFWTHGYMHADKGEERIRIDGEIIIGDNVYIGSRCLFNPGVTVVNSINIGGNSVISKDLTEKGMYVNQPLRHIDTNIDIARKKFDRVLVDDLEEEIYLKK